MGRESLTGLVLWPLLSSVYVIANIIQTVVAEARLLVVLIDEGLLVLLSVGLHPGWELLSLHHSILRLVVELVLLRSLGLKILLLFLYHHLHPVFNLVIKPLDIFLPKLVQDLLPQFVPV